VVDNVSMLLTKKERPVVIVNVVYIGFFTVLALRKLNFEFVLYAGVILVLAGLIFRKQHQVRFGLPILWGLTIWGALHMAGGNIAVGEGVLYDVILLPIVDRMSILRYDQVVHCFGFGVATLIGYHLLRPYLRENITRWGSLAFLIVLIGSGFGAVNELLEGFAVLTFPEANVGGYTNTVCDLFFNFLGGLIAAAWLTWKRHQELRS